MASPEQGSISAFAAAFPNSVTLPSSKSFHDLATKHWASNVITYPSCIFIPKTAQQAALGIKHIVKHAMPFNVRGGGHNANRGWAGINGGDWDDRGVLILTEGLKDKQLLDKGDLLLRIGAGLSTMEIYEYLEGKGVTIAAGNQATPGIAGLLLAGGVGPYWNRVGYAANEVTNFQVVLASGEIVDANITSHPDLFWALKGGLCNFGLVTAIDIITFETGNIWGGAHIVAPDGYNAAFDAFGDYLDRHGESESSTVALLSAGKRSLITSLFYDGPHSDGRASPAEFSKFEALPKVRSTFKKTDWSSFGKASIAQMPHGLRRYWSVLTMYKDVKLLSMIFHLYHSSAEKHLSNIEGGVHQILVLPMSGLPMHKNYSGPWADKNPKRDRFQILILATWKSASDDDRVRGWTEAITQEISQLAKKKGRLHRSVYLNDANETQDAFASYEPENLEKMREVSVKYDPDGIFQTLRKGGPKLW